MYLGPKVVMWEAHTATSIRTYIYIYICTYYVDTWTARVNRYYPF